MNVSLSYVRQEVGRNLAAQVDEIVRDIGGQTDRLIRDMPRLIDGRELRGWPAVGRVRGCVTDQPVPGDDAHLEQLSRARA